MPLWMSSSDASGFCLVSRSGRGDEESVNLSCDVAFETADDLAACLALGQTSLQVAAGAAVPAQTAEDDP